MPPRQSSQDGAEKGDRHGIQPPSQSPFSAPFSASAIYEALKARGILVRYFNQPRLDDKLRITVGTDDQNAVLLAALGEMLRQKK